MHPADPFDERALAAAALAFSLEPAAPPPKLKKRLLDRIADEAKPGLRALRKEAVMWRPTPVPGVAFAELLYDEAARVATLLVRMAPGASYPSHRHDAVEQCLILEGDLERGGRSFCAGDFIWGEPASEDPVIRTRSGALLLILGPRPDSAGHVMV
jgi:hypothetical protein